MLLINIEQFLLIPFSSTRCSHFHLYPTFLYHRRRKKGETIYHGESTYKVRVLIIHAECLTRCQMSAEILKGGARKPF